jgi:hypothetical protein
MKGWKGDWINRAARVMDLANVYIINGRISAELAELLRECNEHRAEKRKAREAVDLYEHEDGFDRNEAASDEVDTKPADPVIPEGWRKLGDEEIIKEGDRIVSFGSWLNVSKSIGNKAGLPFDGWAGPWCAIRKIEEPAKDAPLSDEYLATWVPRMEEVASLQPGRCNFPGTYCRAGYCPMKGLCIRSGRSGSR